MNNYQMEVIGMTIEELKNEVIKNVGDYVTDTAKAALLAWISAKILPSAREMADVYIAAIKETAEHETGWCRARDTLIIPCLISGGLWLAEQAVAKVAELK